MAAISPEAATAAIRARLTRFPTESLPLNRCLGATLRQSVYAERDLPPFDRVCMDGIAVSSEALRKGVREFHLQGMQAAGSPALALAEPGNAIEIMTGAILPVGCDYVIPIEQCQLREGAASVADEAADRPAYHNIQRRGDDGLKGALVLESGSLIGPNEIAVAASCGMARLEVSARPAVMVVSTGDELVDPGNRLPNIRFAGRTPTRWWRHCRPVVSPTSTAITSSTMRRPCVSAWNCTCRPTIC